MTKLSQPNLQLLKHSLPADTFVAPSYSIFDKWVMTKYSQPIAIFSKLYKIDILIFFIKFANQYQTIV